MHYEVVGQDIDGQHPQVLGVFEAKNDSQALMVAIEMFSSAFFTFGHVTLTQIGPEPDAFDASAHVESHRRG